MPQTVNTNDSKQTQRTRHRVFICQPPPIIYLYFPKDVWRCLEILPVCIGRSPFLHCSDIPPMQFMVCRSIFLIKQSSGKSLRARRVACLAGRLLHIAHQCSWKPKAHHIMKFWEVFTLDMVAAKRLGSTRTYSNTNMSTRLQHVQAAWR